LILRYRDKTPDIDETAYIAEGASVIGDVVIGADASIWFGCVLRGDVNYIRIGARTNVQDLTVIHVNHGTHPTVLEEDVTVGHRAILHGCRVKRGSLIGMGAILLDDVVVEERALVAAGSVVSPGTVVPSGKLARGIPARVARDLTQEELDGLEEAAAHYCDIKNDYLQQGGAR
jgi:carbonic anhydrase/acetyltransferase-like protein (isoleucine patch superfamily)